MAQQERNRSDSLASDTSDREIVITRLLDAPRELVFRVWTDPRHVVHWWGPAGFTNTNREMDVRPGGAWRFVMHGPDGVDYNNRCVYTEVVPPERLVYIHDADIENDPDSFHVTVTFEKQGGKTLLTMRSLFRSAAARDYVIKEYGALDGANQHVDRLAAYLAREQTK